MPDCRQPRMLASMALIAFLASCQFIETPPQKVSTPLPLSTATPAAQSASQQFWTALHGNNYAALPAVIAALDAEFVRHPNDATLAMLLGMSYVWLNFEQYRADAPRSNPQFASLLAQSGARAVGNLARARQLAPGDRVLPGFVAAAQFVQARSSRDADGEYAAWTEMLANTQKYPQFQGFIQGWVLTAIYPAGSAQFADGINGYFATLDACVGDKVSRTDPSAPEFIFNVLAKADPACYNTDIAPHNLEGTFLGLGDAFAKNGQLSQARASYENARRTPSYGTWPYKDVLEARLAQIGQLQAKFAADSGQLRVSTAPAMFFQSAYSCTACHAR